MKTLIQALLCALLFFSPQVFTDDRASKEKELQKLKSRIEKLRGTIEVKEKSKSSTVEQLRRIEKKIGVLGGEIRATSRALRNQKKNLQQLQREQTGIRDEIRRQNKQLSDQLYSAYTLGSQEQVKLLFSQDNATQLQRNLTYYEYFNRYRLNLISSAEQTQRELEENERETRLAQQQLEQILSEQKSQKTALDRDRKQREIILSNLEKELKKQGRNLDRLERDAEHLSQLIESLAEILTDIPAVPEKTQKFTQLRGKLAWPVKGKLVNLYGKPKPPSNLRWQGVIIRAPMGNNVRAVSHGRVAFADWLRGMGNLIIIDHGDGYLSLYGHNQSLFKSTGDWVDAGDIIASIGNSGGQKKAGVYFEIRKKGQPQNPGRWCKTENWFAT